MRSLFRFTRNFIFIGLVVLFLPYLVSRIQSQNRQIEVIENTIIASTAPFEDSQLTVACYNIAHGRGLVYDNWNGESKSTRLERLDQIADIILKMDADLIVLNEVDFKCTWSHQINQAAYLANKAGYRWRVEERNMDFRLGWVQWKFGNAVLSKYPIESAEVVDLPALKEWENWLVGKKRGVVARIRTGKQPIGLAAVHLSHRSEDLRVASVRHLIELAKNDPFPFIIGGDLNSTPPDFPKSNKSAIGENAIATLDAANLFNRYPMDKPIPKLMTFPADQPNSKIDWIIVPKQFSVTDYQVLKTTLSDHLPVVTTLKIENK